MTAIRDLAHELLLTGVSVRTHCRRVGIGTHRRLPEGSRSGQCIAFVSDDDAARIREFYAHRLADRAG